SALNVAASMDVAALAPPAAAAPEGPRSVWDVGCGAGLLTLVAARTGAAVFASDVDETIVAWARLNLGLNGREAELGVGDLFAAAPPERRFDLLMFNAPLLRAPLAVADEMPRYLAAPRAEALALAFLDGLGARLSDGGRALLHAQLTPPVDAALADWG